MRLVTVAQMREIDARAQARIGSVATMRDAGAAIARAIETRAPNARHLVAFAGPGNNGGDAFAAFAAIDARVSRVVYAAPARQPSEARRDAEIRARVSGVRVVEGLPATPPEADAAIAGADVVVDALLGIGARPSADPSLHETIRAINRSGTFVLAVDVPTGVDATTGAVEDEAVCATATVTLGAVKLGLTLDPARTNVGSLLFAEIGMAESDHSDGSVRYEMLDDREFLALLPVRAAATDKRAAGAPLIVAGSPAYPGAGVLCARGAARAGAGYVTVAAPQGAVPAMQAHLLEQVVVGYDTARIGAAVDRLDDLLAHGGALGVGPGLGDDDAIGEIVRRLIERLHVPFVADAGAFRHLSEHLEILRGKPCVLTPHDSEFARLSGDGKIEPGDRLRRLRAFVTRTGATTLLKGRSTLIDDGTTVHVNPTGTNALATAGTGDVLTGMTATLLSQGLAPVDAARAAAYWHGLAGRLAHERRRVGVVAGDLPELLADALPVATAERDGDLRTIF